MQVKQEVVLSFLLEDNKINDLTFQVKKLEETRDETQSKQKKEDREEGGRGRREERLHGNRIEGREISEAQISSLWQPPPATDIQPDLSVKRKRPYGLTILGVREETSVQILKLL